MIAYTGRSGCIRTVRTLREAGIRTLVQRGAFRACGAARVRSMKAAPPPERYAYDTRVFEDWQAGRPFDAVAMLEYQVDVLAAAALPDERRPDWIALPDVVADGAASLALTLRALEQLDRIGMLDAGLRYALVVQDGMMPTALPWHWPFEVIFVGGSTAWKWATLEAWTAAARERGRVVHVGRAGSMRSVLRVRRAGAASLDSSLPLWSTAKLERFIRALTCPMPEAA